MEDVARNVPQGVYIDLDNDTTEMRCYLSCTRFVLVVNTEKYESLARHGTIFYCCHERTFLSERIAPQKSADESKMTGLPAKGKESTTSKLPDCGMDVVPSGTHSV